MPLQSHQLDQPASTPASAPASAPESSLRADQHRLTKSKGPSKTGVPHVCAMHGCTLPVYFSDRFDYDRWAILLAILLAIRLAAIVLAILLGPPRKCLLKLMVEEYACVTVCKFHDGAEGQH